ncbi:MAG: Na+/H+ antiporter subunit E [Rickettsiales bacterium]|nr:Na+/H+ antiporter subunit E [Rickettsiales bacterium]
MLIKKAYLNGKKNTASGGVKVLSNLFSYLKIFTLICLLWALFSGSKDPFLVKCGVISIIATFVLCIVGSIISPNSYVVRLGFFKYVFILLRDVVVSTLQMVKIIYSEKLNIDPGTITMNVSKLNDQEKVLFANLITMTPGTFVIAIEGDNFLIHALNRKDLEFKNNNDITKLLKKMRGSDEKKELEDKIVITGLPQEKL